MKYILKDYQSDAVQEVLRNLADARIFFHDRSRESQFSLTATTGAGKTVMAAGVIEALFYGDEAFDWEPDPTAVILWFSDDPALNEQTRFRLMEASDRIVHSDLVVVQHPFAVEKFAAGKVYFLNTGKLTKSSLLTRGYEAGDEENQFEMMRVSTTPDLQAYTIWDTIRNTIENSRLTLYMVLDEAHRGFGTKPSTDKPTIVKRLINGQGDVPPMPVVWGVSATVQRFEDAMRTAEVSANRLGLPKIIVDPIRVQESGLLKDDIVLDIPAESGKFDTVLLGRATRKIVEVTRAWAEYAAEQPDTVPVVPLMVLQSSNTPDPAMLARALDTIFAEWSDLPANAVAHVLGEHTTQQWGGYRVPHISPERVQDATQVRVLIAKDAISTGWDCPRAEVLISFRAAKDATHITQLLGRMIRTPLARRIPGDNRLNSVDCILPFFDHKTATNVVKVLTGVLEDFPDGAGGRRVLIEPQEMTPNSVIEEAIWEALETLPSQSLPKRGAKPVKRLTALAQALAMDGLRPDAGKDAHKELHAVIDGLGARYKDEVDAAVTEVWTVHGETVTGHAGAESLSYSRFAETADDRSIQDAFREAARAFSPDLAGTYVDHIAGPDAPNADDDGLRDAYVKTAALALVPEVREELEREADRLTRGWLDRYRVDIKALSDERQAVYNDVRAMSTEPQRLAVTRPRNRIEETARQDDDGNKHPLPARKRHLLADEHGDFPVGSLNEWELDVLDKELGRTSTVAWYRNPARASQDSLGVAYTDTSGDWRTLRPDFLFFRQGDGKVEVSLVDPHSHHLADALPKLRGLAAFTQTYENEFHRIEAVAKIGDTLRVLDMTDPKVRDAVAKAPDAKTLYESGIAGNY